MPGRDRFDWHGRLKAVEREFDVARRASAVYTREVDAGRESLPAQSDGSDLLRTAASLPGTYVIRLFAVFEAALRSYWSSLRKNDRIPAKQLIDSLATRRGVPDADRRKVHAVRDDRNATVHESGEVVQTVAVSEARGRLAKFLSRLPDEW